MTTTHLGNGVGAKDWKFSWDQRLKPLTAVTSLGVRDFRLLNAKINIKDII
jgi:hypothetical protein